MSGGLQGEPVTRKAFPDHLHMYCAEWGGKAVIQRMNAADGKVLADRVVHRDPLEASFFDADASMGRRLSRRRFAWI